MAPATPALVRPMNSLRLRLFMDVVSRMLGAYVGSATGTNERGAGGAGRAGWAERAEIGGNAASEPDTVRPMVQLIRSQRAAAAVIALSVVTAAAVHQPARAQALPDVQKLGPQVGDRVPDFTLRDQDGRQRTLASLIGPKGLMLVFFRSADW